MLVAAWTVHRGCGFYIAENGWEYNAVLALGAVAVAIAGPGRLGLDQGLFGDDSLSGWAGFLISGVLGVGSGIVLLLACFRLARPESA